MVEGFFQSSWRALCLRAEKSGEAELGRLGPVPRFERLLSILPDTPGRACYAAVHQTIADLGRAMQLGQHRSLINDLDTCLNYETLTAMTAIASTSSELVIRVLHHTPLRAILQENLNNRRLGGGHPIPAPDGTALTLARDLLYDARVAMLRGSELPRKKQDAINFLYRTCRNDWGDQGDYWNLESHREFGRLHETVRAAGTQRCMQELLQEGGGLSCMQLMPGLLQMLPSTSKMLGDAIIVLQFAVSLAREELSTVLIDEVIWGRAFVNFSKAVGFSKVSAGGGDAPMFWMLDSLCGRVDSSRQEILLEELKFRSRFFPPSMRDLVKRIHQSAALRDYINSTAASYEHKQAFKALEHQRFEMYEMHRKKAARIGISLRAGQRGTSAGVSGCAYAAPEKFLARTLSTALSARFGNDDSAFMIDAVAYAHSQMFDEHENLYSARVRFEFSTPLAIGPGDCLLVSVQFPDRTSQARTYSITYTNTSYQPLKQNDHQIVGTAEVYIRNKGLVSAYLCSQTQGCKVRVAVKSTPHFRLTTNLTQDATTIFIAQGGALGVFVAWLEQTPLHVGKYVLVVCIRQLNQLSFRQELISLAHAMKHNLLIVVVLSKPDKANIADLERARLEIYYGRVDQYLDSTQFNSIQTAYICGTSSFGFDVVKSAFMDGFIGGASTKAPRFKPITTSRLPPLRLHVAPDAQPAQELPMITPVELAQHNSPVDIWIAVGDNVYDISTLSRFHPGGEKILISRGGRQAEGLFHSVHNKSIEIKSMLEHMLIGHLAPLDKDRMTSMDLLDRLIEVQNDLTNHSRFERTPESSPRKLSTVPPTHVMYASVECFCRDWCSLLQEVGVSKPKQDHLHCAWFRLRQTLNAIQAAAYDNFFDDLERCGFAIRTVFRTLTSVSDDIHVSLDNAKSQLGECVLDGVPLSADIFDTCTHQVTVSIVKHTKALQE